MVSEDRGDSVCSYGGRVHNYPLVTEVDSLISP